jgi:hypothetical protein
LGAKLRLEAGCEERRAWSHEETTLELDLVGAVT